MRIRRGLVWLLLVCLLAVTGCGEEPVAEPDYSQMIVPPLDVTITDCLTAQMVETVTGEPMELQAVYEDATQAVYMSVDTDNWQVTVNMQNSTLAGYTSQLALLADAESVEGVGEAAHWCETTSSLMAYARGYMVEICMLVPGVYVPKEETVSLMKVLVENMPVKAVPDAVG